MVKKDNHKKAYVYYNIMHINAIFILNSQYCVLQTLEDVMKIDLIADKSAEEISTLWKAFFTAKKEKLCAVIPSATFLKMKELYGLHKTFLLPLPRKDGYEFFIVQVRFFPI